MSKHWVVIMHENSVSGRCSNGCTFSDPTADASTFVRGFTVALGLQGDTYEILDER